MLITASPSVNLDATSFHIFTELLGLYLSQNICWILCWACITHYVRGKSPNLWYLDYWNKHLHDKKSILDIFTHSSGKTFSKVLLITNQANENYSVPVFLPAEKEGGARLCMLIVLWYVQRRVKGKLCFSPTFSCHWWVLNIFVRHLKSKRVLWFSKDKMTGSYKPSFAHGTRASSCVFKVSS